MTVPLTTQQALMQAKQKIDEITALQAFEWLKKDQAYLIDVRTLDEAQQGIALGSTHCSRDYLEWKICELTQNPNDILILMCAVGGRSLFAAQQLKFMGYTKVYSIAGGYQDWQAQNLPTHQF